MYLTNYNFSLFYDTNISRIVGTEPHEFSAKMLVRFISKVCLYDYLSFGERRLSLQSVSTYFPEINVVTNHFGKKSITEWLREMSLYNQTYDRGIRMGLGPFVAKNLYRYTSLDNFIFRMHADKVSDCLESLIRFSDRVLPLIQKNNHADSWRINNKVLIHRYDWLTLSKCVMMIARLILKKDEDGRSPGQHRLFFAARLTAKIFGRFALKCKTSPFIPHSYTSRHIAQAKRPKQNIVSSPKLKSSARVQNRALIQQQHGQ